MVLSYVDSYTLSNTWEDIAFDSLVIHSVCCHMYIKCCTCSIKYRIFCIMHLNPMSLLRSKWDITFSVFSALLVSAACVTFTVLVVDCEMLQSVSLSLRSLHLTLHSWMSPWSTNAHTDLVHRDQQRSLAPYDSLHFLFSILLIPFPWLEPLPPSVSFLSLLPYTCY